MPHTPKIFAVRLDEQNVRLEFRRRPRLRPPTAAGIVYKGTAAELAAVRSLNGVTSE